MRLIIYFLFFTYLSASLGSRILKKLLRLQMNVDELWSFFV